jgi:hypothetical protein
MQIPWQPSINPVVAGAFGPYWDLAVDFGADPSGVADASPAMAAAMARANAAGRSTNRIYIPAGSYLFDSTVNHLANVIVFGAGPNTILNFPSTVATAWSFAKTFTRAELGNLQILGSQASPAAVGLDLDRSQTNYIHDVQVWDFQIPCDLSAGGVFSAYNVIERCEFNRPTVIGIRSLANSNANRIASTRVFFAYNGTSSAIAMDIADSQGLELDDIQLEACDVGIRMRNNNGLLHVHGDTLYLEPGTNPTTGVVGSCYDIDVSNLFDGTEVVKLTNVVNSGLRGNCNLPPEALVEVDGYSRAFYGARFGGQAVPKRNYVYNGEVLYYGLPSILPGWSVSGSVPVLASDPLHVTGSRSLRATATGTNSNIAVAFTVSDEGVEWVTCGIRYQISAGNVGFFFSGTVGANSRQYVPETTPTGTWRVAWVNVPVDPTNRNGAVGCVIDSVNGNGSILIDEIWAVPGKYAIPSTQYGERIQFLPAPIPIASFVGLVANNLFGPINILTLPATLAPPLDTFCTAPSGVVGAVLRIFGACTGAPAGVMANFHEVYVNIPASGAVVPASYEFLQTIYGANHYHTKDVIVRGTSISGGYNAGDGFAFDYNVALIGWVLA